MPLLPVTVRHPLATIVASVAGLATVTTAHASPAEYRALAGTQVDADSHGEVDLGVRSGPWSAELFTETLDLRYAPTWDRGRASVAMRAEGFAAGLLTSPWVDGAPDPGRALTASYAGPEGGVAWYLPRGGWLGVDAHARLWTFGATDTTLVAVPTEHLTGRFALGGGWWAPDRRVAATLALLAGTPLGDGLSAYDHASSGLPPPELHRGLAPAVTLDAAWVPGWFVAPVAEGRAGIDFSGSTLYAARVGGQVPYVVPLAGAGWAEFRVHTYAAARVGLSLGDADAGPGSGAGATTLAVPTDTRLRWRARLTTDLVALGSLYDDDDRNCLSAMCTSTAPGDIDTLALGLAARLELRRRRAWAQVEGGYAPGLERGDGLLPASALVRLGFDWGSDAPW